MEGSEQEAELALSEDESLPWLESDEYEEEGGFDTAQIAGFAMILLVLTAAVVGGIWLWSKRGMGDAAVADGSTIEAPAGPYKEKPEDPGGKQFAGTGDIAPAVGEGQTRDGKIKDTKPEPAPGPSISTRTTADKVVSTDGVGVQVGAYSNRADAETGWSTLTRQTTALNGVRHRVVKGQADIGTVYRLQAVAGDVTAAKALCNALKADGLACQVKR
ncbi:SPOR domain-containing protein [Altererythrobacter sp.]|uniref:SPOR domain-containing protein n=1 Tax=Altererythrobacter sp. TaxID=1872480 RepID=UPI003D080CE0